MTFKEERPNNWREKAWGNKRSSALIRRTAAIYHPVKWLTLVKIRGILFSHAYFSLYTYSICIWISSTPWFLREAAAWRELLQRLEATTQNTRLCHHHAQKNYHSVPDLLAGCVVEDPSLKQHSILGNVMVFIVLPILPQLLINLSLPSCISLSCASWIQWSKYSISITGVRSITIWLCSFWKLFRLDNSYPMHELLSKF